MELAGQPKIGQALGRAGRGRKKRERGAFSWNKVGELDFAGIAMLAGLSFLLGRVIVLESILPCGIAFLAAMIYRDSLRFYLLPVVFLGMATNLLVRFDIWGDVIAMAVVAVLTLYLKRKKAGLTVVALVTGIATIGAKIAYSLYIDLFFLYDTIMILTQGLLVFLLVFAFHTFFRILQDGSMDSSNSFAGIVALTIVGVLAAGGLGIPNWAIVQPVEAIAMVITLWCGYRLGISEGAVSGLTAGMLLLFVNGGSPALAGVFGLAGMVAGATGSRHRILSGLCFAAVTVLFGLFRGYPELYVSAIDALLALAFFTLLPAGACQRIDLTLDKFSSSADTRNRQRLQKTTEQLARYTDAYESLALLYSRTREPISYQFQGLAKAVRTMKEELAMRPKEGAEEARYSIRIGSASYAKMGVSGDSHICAPIHRTEYLIALSDGMGKGDAAAAESQFTTNTLYHLIRAGFSVELAIKAVNSIKLTKTEEEMFSTVDLGFIDLHSGRIRLYKMGAAATFVKRGNKVSAIKVAALPMGIVDRIRIEDVVFQMKKGDQLIMVSDGITEAGLDGENGGGLEWLEEAIANVMSRDPQTMADLIINKAVERYGLREKDDMTVITALMM